MAILRNDFIKYILLLLTIISSNALADDDEKKKRFDDYANTADKESITKDLHAQLNAIFKRNQNLKSSIVTTDESLDSILSTLKLLDEKLEYRKQSNAIVANSKVVTMADFNSTDDDLVRQCDEIVDNYYTRKIQQEKSYVQNLFNSEQLDPQWERDIENQVQNFIDSNSLTQSDFVDINCTSSVCKMRVLHKTSEAGRRFKNEIRGDSGFDVYDSRNRNDRVTGGVITSITLLKDRKKVREFVWGE